MNFFKSLAGGGEHGGSSTMSEWMATIQDKAKELGEVYKRDLGEFTTTVKKDAVEVINEIAEGEPLAKMAQAISIEATSKPKIPAPAKAVSKLAALQGSEVTYTLDPSEKASYSTFCESFDLESRTAEIEQLFKTQPAMESIHHRLVPEKVAYRVFWSRYFFRAEALKAEERKTQLLLLSASDKLFNDDEDLTWDDEPESVPAAASSEPEKVTADALPERASPPRTVDGGQEADAALVAPPVAPAGDVLAAHLPAVAQLAAQEAQAEAVLAGAANTAGGAANVAEAPAEQEGSDDIMEGGQGVGEHAGVEAPLAEIQVDAGQGDKALAGKHEYKKAFEEDMHNSEEMQSTCEALLKSGYSSSPCIVSLPNSAADSVAASISSSTCSTASQMQQITLMSEEGEAREAKGAADQPPAETEKLKAADDDWDDWE